MDGLVGLVEGWAVDKGLDTADSFKQFAKVAEEFGEIAAALARNNDDELRDAIGDTVVTLIILAKQNGMDLEECLQCAYDEIKGRKGKTVNGIFVKEADLGNTEETSTKYHQFKVGDRVKLLGGVNWGTFFNYPDNSMIITDVINTERVRVFESGEGLSQTVLTGCLVLVEEHEG